MSGAEYNREIVIEMLIESDMQVILECQNEEYLFDILKNGFRGYDDLSDEELIQEIGRAHV